LILNRFDLQFYTTYAGSLTVDWMVTLINCHIDKYPQQITLQESPFLTYRKLKGHTQDNADIQGGGSLDDGE